MSAPDRDGPRLRYVSITGADDEVAPADLAALSREFPFAEWAVLLMPERMGQSRFPSAAWIRDFAARPDAGHRAMHLCGSAFLRFIVGDPEILALMQGFSRVQLNLEFGAVDGAYDPAALIGRIRAHPEFLFIIQYTEKRRDFLSRLDGIAHHAVLFDASAGRGVSPNTWPAPLPGHDCGYAGGLGPDNIREELGRIAQAAGDAETWIDMESRVRTAEDRFDLARVRRVLEICAPFASGRIESGQA